MAKSIITVENLGKKYALGEKQNFYTLRDSITGFFSGKKKKEEEFWALKDINFEIKQGESVGIIGRNGAGKSTLLKILSQITPPTTGKITMRGRVASLLEVGTGFHQELTGRENIFLNGAILGMSRDEVKKKFDEIVAFSEVEKFLDMPVKHYSSGMYMRLAFAVAAHLESEILIVDEVLAVGDAQFQKKCLGKMDEVAKKQGRTVLFVSHNMGAIGQLCCKTMLFNNGMLVNFGSTTDVVSDYLSKVDGFRVNSFEDNYANFFKKVNINNGKSIITGGTVSFDIYYECNNPGAIDYRIALGFYDVNGNFLFVCSTELDNTVNNKLKKTGLINCCIDKLPLSSGSYIVELFSEVNSEIIEWIKNAFILEVGYGKYHRSTKQCPNGYEGAGVLVSHSWVINSQ